MFRTGFAHAMSRRWLLRLVVVLVIAVTTALGGVRLAPKADAMHMSTNCRIHGPAIIGTNAGGIVIENNDGTCPHTYASPATGITPMITDDGEYITLRLNSGSGCQMWKMNIDGSNLHRISPAGVYMGCGGSLRLSPNGQRICFLIREGGPSGPGVYSANDDFTDEVLITPTQGPGSGSQIIEAQCIGNKAYYTMIGSNGQKHIYSADVSGGGQQAQTDETPQESGQPSNLRYENLSVAPDGSMTYSSNKDDSSGDTDNLYVRDSQGNETKLTDSASGTKIELTVVSRDGCRIIYNTNDDNGQGTHVIDLCHPERSGDIDYLSQISLGPIAMSDAINGPCGSCPTGGDPINLASGGATFSDVDLAVSTAGPSLRLSRTYRNKDTRRTTLGPFWRTSLDEQVAVNTGVNAVTGVTWVRGDGADVAFRLVSSTYVPPAGQHEKITLMSDHFVLTDTANVVHTFAPSGHLTKLRDRFGVGYDIGYSSAGSAQEVTHTLGPTISLTYSDATELTLTAATTSDGKSATYGYGGGRLTSATLDGGMTTTYTYDAVGYLSSITDPSGKVIYAHDLYGTSIASQQDGRGNTQHFAYYGDTGEPGEGYAVSTDQFNKTLTSTWDEEGFATSQTNQEGATTRFGYSSKGDRAQVTDAIGAATQTLFNSGGDPVSVTNPLGKTSTSQYRSDHLITKTVDPTGVETDFGYTTAGALSSSTTSGAGTTLLSPNSNGTVSATISPDGLISRTEYDSQGRAVRSIDAGNRSTYTRYNSDGTVSDTTAPSGARAQTLYDSARRPSRVIDPLGNSTAFGYDSAGNQTSVTDTLGRTTRFGYDAAYNLYETSQTVGSQTIKADFSYDAANRLKTAAAPGSSGTSSYGYTPSGQLGAITDSDGVLTTYSYSARGELVGTVGPDGVTSSNTYDDAGRLTQSSNSVDGSVSYSYDDAARLTMAQDDSGRFVYATYDGAGRPNLSIDSTYKDAIGDGRYFGVAPSLSPGGRRNSTLQGQFTFTGSSFVPQDVSEITYTYGADGALTEIQSPQIIGDGAITSTHDPSTGMLTSQGGPGFGVTHGADLAGRATELTRTLAGSSPLAFPTRYDQGGNVTQMAGSTYSYDELGRMVTAHDGELGDDYAYQYDLASNRTKVTKNGSVTQEMTFTAADKIETSSSPQFAYDAAGRLVSDTTPAGEKRHYLWDGHGRLAGIDLYHGSTGQYDNVRYAYDQVGHLSEKTRYLDLTYPVEHLFYHYDGENLVAEEDMTGTVREYLYAGGEAPTAMRARQADGSYKNFFFVTNTHGDVVAVTDRDGNIVNRYAYGPWGEATRVSEQVHQPFRYAGYRYEDGFDLYYLRARWYDAGTGRFLSRDPVPPNPMKLCSLNKYIYTHDNPSSSTDPSGRYPCKQGIYRLAIYVDILADVYVQDNHNVEQVDEFVRQIGLRIAGFPSGHPSFEHHKPPWTFGKKGWNPAYAEDEDEAHHLAAFIVIGYEDYPLSPWEFETFLKGKGNRQDLRLGDVGRELGTNLRLTTRYRGDPIPGGPAGLTAHELGAEIVRRLSTGNCDEYPSGQAEPI